MVELFYKLKTLLNMFEIVNHEIHIDGDNFEIDLEYNQKNWELVKKFIKKYPKNVTLKTTSHYFILVINVGGKNEI